MNLHDKNNFNKDETTVIDMVNTFKNATGLQFMQEGTKWVATGAFMGMSDAIPGYSGGTTLAVLGVFKRLILISKSIFIPEPGITRLKALMFMIPFLAGWIAGVFGFAKLTEWMAAHDMGMELIFFFSTFILFAIPIFIKSENPSLFSIKKKKLKLKKTWRWIIFFFGIGLIVTVTWFTFNKGGVSFHGSENPKGLYELSSSGWFKLAWVAFLSGVVTIIPGGSGAIIQLLSGMYSNIHWTIMAHVGSNVGALFLFAIFTFLGMLFMVFVMAWGLKRHQKTLASLSFGMLIASVFCIFFVPELSTWNNIGNEAHIAGITTSIILAITFSQVIAWRVKKRNNKIKMNVRHKPL